MTAVGRVLGVLLCAGCASGNPTVAATAPPSSRPARPLEVPAGDVEAGLAGLGSGTDQGAALGTVNSAQGESFSPLCAPEQPWCPQVLAALRLISGGNLQEAQHSVDSRSDIPSPIRFYLLGRILLESDSLAYGSRTKSAEEARVLFHNAMALVIADEQTTSLRARLRFQMSRVDLVLGRGDAALQELSKLAQEYPGEAEVHAALGISHLSVGQVAASLQPLRSAVRLNPREPEYSLALGTAQMLLGNEAEAEGSFRRAISLQPTSASAHGNLGALLVVLGRVQEGAGHLQQALRLAPEAPTYLSNLAYAQLLLGQAEDGSRLAARALQGDPKLASAWLNLGLCQVAMGKKVEARKSFEKARSLDPTDPRPQNNLRDLDELESAKQAP